jgi:hypothetical protein
VGEDGAVLFGAAWPDIFESSGIEKLVPGRNYTAVVIGPNPLLIKRGFWNQPGFAIVASDPTAKSQ